jgi:hypothetical protein
MIKRNPEAEKDPGHVFHRMHKAIKWPKDAVYTYRNQQGSPWEFTTRQDILQEKKERINHNLWMKREHDATKRRAAYVWVFWCPGINHFVYRGWWLYIIAKGIDCGKYLENEEKTVSNLLELFPLVPSTLFGPPDMEQWKMEFVKKYKCGMRSGKPQGKAPIWVEVKGCRIVKIIGRGQWKNSSRRHEGIQRI